MGTIKFHILFSISMFGVFIKYNPIKKNQKGNYFPNVNNIEQIHPQITI
jgi:hypothetical protein